MEKHIYIYIYIYINSPTYRYVGKQRVHFFILVYTVNKHICIYIERDR